MAEGPRRYLTTPILATAATIALLVLAGVALFMGWLSPPADTSPTGTSAIIPGKPLPVIESKTGRYEPLMPRYSQPSAPPPAPVAAVPAAKPAPAKAAAPAPAPAPVAPALPQSPAPTYAAPPYPAPAPPRYRSPERGPYPPSYAGAPSRPAPGWDREGRGGYCRDCGTVIAVTSYPDMSEVRVRFQDGGVGTFRFRAGAPFTHGDRVRLDGKRLLHD